MYSVQLRDYNLGFIKNTSITILDEFSIIKGLKAVLYADFSAKKIRLHNFDRPEKSFCELIGYC
jgi:hypothetical protein